MATLIDFTKQGNQVQVTTTVEGVAGAIQCYVGFPVRYSFNAAGLIFNVRIGTDSYSCALADLRISGSGSAPASVAAALTSLSAIFGVFP